MWHFFIFKVISLCYPMCIKHENNLRRVVRVIGFKNSSAITYGQALQMDMKVFELLVNLKPVEVSKCPQDIICTSTKVALVY